MMLDRAAIAGSLMTTGLFVCPATAAERAVCAADNAGLTLQAELCVTVFADNLGQARHMAVGADGTIYVNTQRSPYKPHAEIPAGGWLVALRDVDGDGRAEQVVRFGPDSATGVGGTGVAVHRGFLYAETNGRVERYSLAEGPVPRGPATVVLDGLPMDGDHTMHSFAIDAAGTLIINSGSATNACQGVNRTPNSPGLDPCPELETRAGLWRYDANLMGQHFSPADRYVSGLRNTVGLAFHPSRSVLFTLQHGRDQLYENWPQRFTKAQGSELPAEILVRITPGADYGWPYCYYDGIQNRHILAPEYGGDGKRTARCTGNPEPVVAYPAHWAPNAMLFYTGDTLPARYHNGLFIAFHGSWNREQQQGYNLVFQPMDLTGAPSGEYEVFADGFAGPVKSPEGAAHRPSGLAVGLDGALYISDDQGGRIYRIQGKPEIAETPRSR